VYFSLKGGILIFVDIDPHVISFHAVVAVIISFIQIAFGHTVLQV